jgi:hypothetical protein
MSQACPSPGTDVTIDHYTVAIHTVAIHPVAIAMKPFEYLLIFAAIILGLAVTDLATSLHRLLGAKQRVKWDWLAPLAAILALLVILVHWWSWYRANTLANGFTFEQYLLIIVSTVLLFLMAAAALPDESREPIIDLRQHYQTVCRRYWVLFTAHWILVQIVSLWTQVAINHVNLDLVSPLWLIVPAGIVLAVFRNRALHLVGLVGFILLYGLVDAGHRLGT